MRFAWVCLAVALAGCETGSGGNDLGVCSTVCRCLGALPSQERVCVEECLDTAALFASRACEACVFENASSCSHMGERCFASGLCSDPDPEPPPGRPDAGF
jgi:hypothetical protein